MFDMMKHKSRSILTNDCTNFDVAQVFDNKKYSMVFELKI